MPNIMSPMNAASLLLDSSKGIDKFQLSDFTIGSQVRGTNTIVKNSDGSYSFKTQGGSTSGGTDVVYCLSKDHIWKGIIAVEVEFYNISYGAHQCYGAWGNRSIIFNQKLANGQHWIFLMSNQYLNNCFSIGITAVGPACELKLIRAWQLKEYKSGRIHTGGSISE